MFIFDKKGFQNIFHFFDEIKQIAKEALESIKMCVPIKNFDEFTNDCGRHIWKQRKLKKIASKPYLGKIKMDHIKRVIEQNKLSIQIVKVYEYSEDILVEQPTIDLFAELGYETANTFHEKLGKHGTLGREMDNEVVLVPRLRAALQQLNPD